jgi:integrase
MQLALMLAIWTGQRQGDLLRLPWSAYDGAHIRLQQFKTGRRIVMPAGAPLKTLLDATEPPGTGHPHQLARPALDRGRVQVLLGQAVGPRRHRRPHVSRSQGYGRRALAIASATAPQIATFTGHSLRDVEAILDAHYLGRDVQLAEAAVLKLEARTKL